MPAVSLSWCHTPRVSALHAAELCYRQLGWAALPIQGQVQPFAETLAARVSRLFPDPNVFWLHVPPRCLGEPDIRTLIDEAFQLAGLARVTSPAKELTAIFQQLCNAFLQAVPDLEDQLALRSRPLRELWEARGPGLIGFLTQMLKVPLTAGPIRAMPVYPIRGGWGVAHPKYASLRIEAVLTNPAVRLPETVRLAWLVGQVLVGSGMPSSWLDRPGCQQLLSLALLPPVLQAAAYVEWIDSDEQLVQEAAHLWCNRLLTQRQADTLWRWWNDSQHGPLFIEAVYRLEASWPKY